MSESSSDGVSTWQYDASSQVIAADHTRQASERYTYDATGNRTAATQSSGTANAITTGANNRLLADDRYRYEYDAEVIDPARLDAMGRTNLQRMQQGLAPLGPDGRSINLHHLIQTQDGAIEGMTATFHQQYSRVIQINPDTIPSGINRSAFDAWRRSYWMNRATDLRLPP